MDFESVTKLLEKEEEDEFTIDSMPERFIETLIMEGIKINRIERGRVVCSFTIPPRLLNDDNSLNAGATATMVDVVGASVIHTVIGDGASSVSVEINVSYLGRASLGEEIEIESKALHVGKAVAVVSVNFTSKRTGKIIAQGRHTKYLLASSKL